ncbi:hypothetical protein V5O48_008888 [Marasmius crinis-equi]|uniref:F-box domain-containing protein n=1 Tax=Marasmius crinis-equi TaxID=585013 RepID=A0ABR3FCM4_9AGAR
MLNRSPEWFIPPATDQNTQGLHVRFIESLLRYSRRWKALSLSHLPAHALAPFNRLTSEDLPLLEEFRDPGMLSNNFISPGMTANDIQYSSFISTVGNLPSLRNLRISFRGEFDLPPQFEWSRLTVLHIRFSRSPGSFDSLSSLQRISQLCPLLAECTLSLRYPVAGAEPAQETSRIESQEWRSLQKLDLSLTGPGSTSFAYYISTLFRSITIPALKHLSLFVKCHQFHTQAPNDPPSPRPIHVDQAIEDLVLRSQCELARLDLTIPSWDNLGMTLDVLPSLTTFNVDPSFSTVFPAELPIGTSSFETIFQALMPSAGSIRCPKLEKLSINRCLTQNAVDLVDLADARARTTPLQVLRARFGMLSVGNIRTLKSVLESGKSKGLGRKIQCEFTRQNPADYFDDPYPFAGGLEIGSEVLSGELGG